jgi:hypothetical protein
VFADSLAAIKTFLFIGNADDLAKPTGGDDLESQDIGLTEFPIGNRQRALLGAER